MCSDRTGPGTRVFGAEFLAHHARKDASGCTDLCHFLEQIHPAVDQNRDARSE